MQPTQPLFARVIRKLRLTTKMVNKGFYKGTGTGSMGRHTRYGGYIINWEKVRTYVAPDTRDFSLTPFVWKGISTTKELPAAMKDAKPQEKEKYRLDRMGVHDGKSYLRKWKQEGGEPASYLY